MSDGQRPLGVPGLPRVPRPVERDVDDEIAFHLAMRIDALRHAGLSESEARSRAISDFGDVDASRRELAAADRRRRSRLRRGQLAEAIVQDVRYAVGSLRRAPVFALTALVTMTIGIGACAAIFTIVNGVLLRPLPYGHSGRLAVASFDMPKIGLYHEPQWAGSYFTYRQLAKTIDGIGIYDETAVNLSVPGGPEARRVTSASVSATLLPLLEVRPLLGRFFTEEEDRPGGHPAVILSERLWRAMLGADSSAIGRSLDVNGITREIVGVMPASFRFPNANTQLWTPERIDPVALDGSAYSHTGIVRVKAGVSLDAVRREFAALFPRAVELHPNFVTGLSAAAMLRQTEPRPVVTPLAEDMTSGVARSLWMIFASAALVLCVAIANVTNLMLVRSDARRREMAVREALGAGRLRVLLCFFAEPFVLAALASVAGVALAAIAVRWLVSSAAVDLPRAAEVGMGWATIGFALLLAVLVAVVSGGVPAIRAFRSATPLGAGNRGGTTSKAQHRLRAALVSAQLALALVVLAGSGLLLRTYRQLASVQPGFDPNGLSTWWISLPRARYSDSATIRFFTDLEERARHVPGVTSVALTTRLPLERFGTDPNPIYPEDDPTWATRLPPLEMLATVGGDYFGTMGIPIVAGRGFMPMRVQREGEAVISRATASLFWHDSTGVSVIGKRFRVLPTGPLYTVVGVVADARDSSLVLPLSPFVYFPEVIGTDTVTRQLRRNMALVVRGGSPPSATDAAVLGIVHDLDPAIPTFEARSMDAVLSSTTARLRFVIAILGGGASATLLLGVVGLYGVLAYLVTLRSREFGIRIALGATPASVAAALTRYGMVLATIGVAIGLVLFVFVGAFLRGFLFGVAPTDAVTLIGASALLIVVASLASWGPARRAARVDPATSLRAE